MICKKCRMKQETPLLFDRWCLPCWRRYNMDQLTGCARKGIPGTVEFLNYAYDRLTNPIPCRRTKKQGPLRDQ